LEGTRKKCGNRGIEVVVRGTDFAKSSKDEAFQMVRLQELRLQAAEDGDILFVLSIATVDGTVDLLMET
jgi:hypothetical protein